MKTLELLGIIGSVVTVGIALGAVIIGSNANLHAELRTEMQELRMEVRTEVQNLRTEVRADIHALENRLSSVEQRLSSVEQRLARAEGLLEGLRDAITTHGRRDPRGENEAT